jgi:hypothetical protein
MSFFNWFRSTPKTQVPSRNITDIYEAAVKDLGNSGQKCPVELLDHFVMMMRNNFSAESIRNALGTSNSVARRQIQKLLLASGKLSFSEVPYGGPPIRDLTQEQVVEQVKHWVLFRDTAEAYVQGSIVAASVLDANQIKAIYLSEKPLTLQDFPFKWAVHCMYHGASPHP